MCCKLKYFLLFEASNDDFCYICCEHEFGSMHENEKEDCFDLCDRFLGLGVNTRPGKVRN